MSIDASTVQTMSAATGIYGAIAGAGGAYGSAIAAKAQGRMLGRAAEQNAALAEWQAQDAQRRGEIAARDHQTKVSQMRGAQRAAIAGNGIRADSGSALAILDDTQIMGLVDTSRIRENSAREALGYRMAASQASAQGEIYKAGAEGVRPGMAAATTILGSAGMVADRWYRTNRANT